MTPERFAALADAYGGAIDRWPADERDAARHYLARHADAHSVLTHAAGLDTMLASWTVPSPGAALAGRIAMTITHGQTHRQRIRLWLSGLGAATALASGAVAGALVVMLWAPAPDDASATSTIYELSVFGSPIDPGSQPGANGPL